MPYPYFKPGTRVFVQGATGKEGQRGVEFMNNYHTSVTAGITPGKAGQQVMGVPVFNSVQEAVDAVGLADVAVLYVPAKAVKPAIIEAVDAGVRFINVLAEGIPYQDLAYIAQLCQKRRVVLLGPGSLGILAVDEGRIGMVGGDNPAAIYHKGSVSVISRSGGMTNEIGHFLCTHGVGVRIVVHLGTELICGTSLIDHIKALNQDTETSSIIIFEEVTHASLAELAVFCEKNTIAKPLYLMVAGKSKSVMPNGASFGHVDVLLGQGDDWLKNIGRLKASGAIVVDNYEELINYLT